MDLQKPKNYYFDLSIYSASKMFFYQIFIVSILLAFSAAETSLRLAEETTNENNENNEKINDEVSTGQDNRDRYRNQYGGNVDGGGIRQVNIIF